MNIIFITENVSRQGNPNFESAERWREILCGVEKETRDGLRILMDIVRIVGQKSKSEERLAVKILLFLSCRRGDAENYMEVFRKLVKCLVYHIGSH